MRCPFLHETQVKSCRASSCRKMIVQAAGQSSEGRCSSSAYVECPAAKPLLEGTAAMEQCPFLHDSLVQFCGASSLTKYIPYSEEVLSHCGTDSHRYCELYLTLAQPERHAAMSTTGIEVCDNPPLEREVLVEGVRVRTDLHYSPNHMWADVSEDNTVHVGIDAFLAQLLGKVDQISYVTPRGTHRPAVVLTVNGTDLPMIFPRNMSISAVNSSLRTHPSRLFVDPYTTGWLFEGTDLEEEDARLKGSAESSLLVTGNEAVAWMRDEVRRASTLVHELSHAGDAQGTVLMADGGNPQPGLGQHLTREELLHLFNELLSPLAGWRKP